MYVIRESARGIGGHTAAVAGVVLSEAVDTARHGLNRSTGQHVNRSPVVASRLRAGARGLLELVQAMPSEFTGSGWGANDDACGGSG